MCQSHIQFYIDPASYTCNYNCPVTDPCCAWNITTASNSLPITGENDNEYSIKAMRQIESYDLSRHLGLDSN